MCSFGFTWFKNGALFTIIFALSSQSYGISIKEYVEGALASSPSTEAALERVRSAEIGVEAARLAYLPKFILSYSYNQSTTVTPTITSKTWSTSPYVSVSLVLWDSGVRKYSVELAESAYQSSQISARAARQALIVQTLKAYAAWDGQSSLEYIYKQMETAMENLIRGWSKAGKLTEATRKLLEAKQSEYKVKQKSVRVLADILAIQVEGISGISPKPYVESTREEFAAITKFYIDLLLEKPLPSVEEAEQSLLQNNLSIIASQKGLDSLRLSQLLTQAATIGPKVSVNASLSSSRGTNELLSNGMTLESPLSQRGNSIGVSVSVPFDLQSIKNLGRNDHDRRAGELSHEQLVKDLKTAVRSSRSSISIVKAQVSQLREGLGATKFDFKNFNKSEAEVSVANFVVYLSSIEQQMVTINSQAGILFSATVDFISLIYNLENYLQDLKY
jgi:outer membrane protein TolC